MSLFRVSIELDTQGEARSLTERFTDLIDPAPQATSYFEIPGTKRWQVDAYMESKPEASILIAVLGLPPETRVQVSEVPDENWVAISQAALPPVEAGRITVHGSHDRARVGLRQFAIEIDAGEAFGTAHHSTTEGCLIALDRVMRVRPYQRVADIGCGSGVLAIAAARLGPRARFIASDFDPVAAGVAHANVRANRAGSRISVVAASGLDHPTLRGAQRFDLVIANILARPLVALASSIRHALAPGGIVVLSGLLVEQAREVLGTYLARGFNLERRIVLNGWTTLVLKRNGRPFGPPASDCVASRMDHTRQARGVKSSRVRTRGSSSCSIPMSLRTWSSKAASSARSAHWA